MVLYLVYVPSVVSLVGIPGIYHPMYLGIHHPGIHPTYPPWVYHGVHLPATYCQCGT